MQNLKIAAKRHLRWPTNTYSPQILDRYRLIFVHVPKTGGTSIGAALKQYGPSTHRYPQLIRHAKAHELRSAIGPQKWNQYTSLAVVRNPWDWAVSCYHWWTQRADRHSTLQTKASDIKAMGSFQAFVESQFFETHINEFPAQDYSAWLLSDNQSICTTILRFETLNDDWEQFIAKHNYPFASLPQLNRTIRKDYRTYYTAKTIDIVSRKFQDSIQRFNYCFE